MRSAFKASENSFLKDTQSNIKSEVGAGLVVDKQYKLMGCISNEGDFDILMSNLNRGSAPMLYTMVNRRLHLGKISGDFGAIAYYNDLLLNVRCRVLNKPSLRYSKSSFLSLKTRIEYDLDRKDFIRGSTGEFVHDLTSNAESSSFKLVDTEESSPKVSGEATAPKGEP
jgi:hypothetical protein